MVLRVYVLVLKEADNDADVDANEERRRDNNEESVIGRIRPANLQRITLYYFFCNRGTDNFGEKANFRPAYRHMPAV